MEVENVKKSSFKENLYLTVPLIFEWQFPAKKYQRAYVAAGVMGGLRLHTKTKVVYKNENGDTRRMKNSGNYSMNPVKQMRGSCRILQTGIMGKLHSYEHDGKEQSPRNPPVHNRGLG